MKIVSIGDSFFYGTDLEDCNHSPSQHTWPALIARQLHLSYHCLARPGVGNVSILQQIISGLLEHGRDAVYLINWSWIDRFDYIDFVDNTWHTTRPSQADSIKDPVYYKNFHSELMDKFSTLNSISHAVELLKGHRYIMTYMDKLILDGHWHAPNYVRYLQHRVRSHLHDFSGATFLEWSRLNGHPESSHWHPLESAHQAAAIYWLPAVKEMI